MPLPAALSAALTSAGINLGVSLIGMAFDRRRGLRRHQQQFTDSGRNFGDLEIPVEPFPYLWGWHPRYTPQLIYASVTKFEENVRGQNDPPGTRSQPATGHRLHLAYLVSRGEIQAIDSLWIDGDWQQLTWTATGDGEAIKADLPFNGIIRAYLRADGTQGANLRRQTLALANQFNPRTGQTGEARWGTDDQVNGFSWIYISFDAKPRDLDLVPDTELKSWPHIELEVRGRKIPRPDGTVAYTENAADIAADMIRVAGGGETLDRADWADSSRVADMEVEGVYHDAYDPNDPMRIGGTLYWQQAATQPATPTTFSPPSGWDDTVPTAAPASGMHWWTTYRTGIPSDFTYTDPIIWRLAGPDVNDPNCLVGLIGMSRVTQRFGAGPGPINPPVIKTSVTSYWVEAATKPALPTTFAAPADYQSERPNRAPATGMKWWLTVRTGNASSFNWSQFLEWTYVAPGTPGPGNPFDPRPPIVIQIPIPPGTPPAPPSNPGSEYMGRYDDEERRHILYPASVLAYSDEFDAATLSSNLNRLAFNMQGAIRYANGRAHIQAGYARDSIGTVTDGTDGVMGRFESGYTADRQWNAVSLDVAYAGFTGKREAMPTMRDQARITRQGSETTLRLGVQPYISHRSHAQRMLVTTLVRLRHQRNGVFNLDAGHSLVASSRVGSRITIASKQHDLRSFDLVSGEIVEAPDTDFLITGRADLPDGSVALTIEEDPDDNWNVYYSMPPIDPDVSSAGVLVPIPEDVEIESSANLTPDGRWQTSGIMRCKPAAVHRTDFRYRITLVAGEALAQVVNGIRIDRTPGIYESGWAIVSAGRGYTAEIPDAKAGITYECQARHASVLRDGNWSASATRTIGVDTAGPAAPSSVTVTPMTGDYQIQHDLPTEVDYGLTVVRDIRLESTSATPLPAAQFRGAYRGSGGIFQLGGSQTPGKGTAWLRHEDHSGNPSTWTRADVEQYGPDNNEVYVDIVWALGNSSTNPPPAPGSPQSTADRIPPDPTTTNPYLWGWARTATRTSGGLELTWSGWGSAVPWGTHPDTEPSGVFVSQIQFERRSRSDTMVREALDDLVSDTFPYYDIRLRRRTSTMDSWSQYGPWVLMAVRIMGCVYEGVFARFQALQGTNPGITESTDDPVDVPAGDYAGWSLQDLDFSDSDMRPGWVGTDYGIRDTMPYGDAVHLTSFGSLVGGHQGHGLFWPILAGGTRYYIAWLYNPTSTTPAEDGAWYWTTNPSLGSWTLWFTSGEPPAALSTALTYTGNLSEQPANAVNHWQFTGVTNEPEFSIATQGFGIVRRDSTNQDLFVSYRDFSVTSGMGRWKLQWYRRAST